MDEQLSNPLYHESRRLGKGFSVVSLATERVQKQIYNERDVLRLKMEHLDFRNDMNMTPLHLATMYGHME